MNRPRRAKSWLQLALCLAMWLGLLVPVAPAAAAVTAPATVNAAAPATTPSATTTPGTTTAEQEVVALRTRTSRTYQTARGYQAVISTHSVNYQDATGAWQPIDDSLVPATTSGYAYQNTANAYTALLPAALGSPVTMKRGNVSVSFTLVGASGTLTTKADTASYAAALPGVDVAYQAQADALEETLTLHSAAAAATYTYTLATSGVTARANAMGGVDFLDGAGQVQLSFAPPIMQDSSHTPAGLSRAVHLTLAPDGASVTLAADPAWLADPARVYPVVLDPTAVATPDDQCTIGSGPEADLNMCGLPTYYLGNDGTEVHRSLLQFYTKELPAQANVLNADLAVYVTYQSGGGSMAMQAFQLTQSWAGGGSTTWDAASSGVGWTTPGGTYAPTIQYQTTLGATGTWYHWGITNLVQGWANGTVANNYGVLLKAADEMTAGYWGFDATTDSTAPTLTVTYQPWIGEQAFWGYSRRQLTDRMDINVNLANGAVIAHSNDLAIAGTGLPVSLDRYYNQTLTTVDINTTPTHELGPNWVLDWGSTWYLATSGLNGVAYYEPGGDAFMFAANPDGSFTHPPGLDALLVKNGDGTYTLTDQATGTRDHFAAPDSDGIARPTALVDRDGNTISLQRNADGTLAAIVDTQGRTISFGYVAGTSPSYLGSVTDSSGRTVNYAYDGKYLDHVVDANGKTTAYRYSDDILQKIIDANGNTTLINYANSQVSSIVYVTDPNTNTGPTYAFAYNTGNTVVTDPNNHQTTYYYDVYGRITKVVDALGNSQQYSYTADNNVAQYTDAASKVTTLTYSTDGRNNLIQAQGPTGYAASWQYTDSAHPYYPTQFTTCATGFRAG